MIEVRPQADGDIQIYAAEDNAIGSFIGINLDDHQGLKLWLDMAQFYKAKGHNMDRVLNASPVGAPGFWARLGAALKYIIGG